MMKRLIDYQRSMIEITNLVNSAKPRSIDSNQSEAEYILAGVFGGWASD